MDRDSAQGRGSTVGRLRSPSSSLLAGAPTALLSGHVLNPSEESARLLMGRGIQGPVSMLNLLRFRDEADYSAFPELAPPTPISGRAAYDRYVSHTMPFLSAAGASVTLFGTGGPYFIGPPDERWDLVVLIRQSSVEEFLASPRMRDTWPAWATPRPWRIPGCSRSLIDLCPERPPPAGLPARVAGRAAGPVRSPRRTRRSRCRRADARPGCFA